MADRQRIARQWLLLRMLSARSPGATVREMVAETGVGDRTVRRDLDLLRGAGFLLEETVSDHGRKHWRLADGARKPALTFTWAEAGALYVAHRLLEPLAGTRPPNWQFFDDF